MSATSATRAKPAKLPELRAEGGVLENDRVRLNFDERGYLAGVRDVKAGYDMLRGAGNQLSVYADDGDAAHIDPRSLRRRAGAFVQVEAHNEAEGAVCRRIAEYRFGDSTISQTVEITAGSARVDFITRVDWRERNKLLRAEFPLNISAADYSGWLMDKHGILSPDERARVVAAIRRYKYPCSDCRGLVALLYDAHILSDYTGHSRTVRTCDLKHLMQLVAEWKLLEPQRGQVATTPESVSNRSSLAEVAQTLASQRISWYEGESDALAVAKYWPDAEAFDRLSGEWSAAFVYHCCYEAGFILPVHAPDVEYGFDTVKGWLDFASLLSNGFYHPKGESGFMPERGDIVIFDRLLEDKQPADHMGIVVLTSADRITVAEGNARKSNVSDVIEHSATHHVRGYIRLPNCYQFRRQA